MFKLNISPSGETLYVDDTRSLLDHLRDNQIYVKSSCGGHASCTDCIIKVLDGKDNLNEPTKDELRLIGNVFHITKERLACQSFVSGEVTIDLSMHDKKSHEQRRQDKSKKVSSMIKVRKQQEVKEILEDRMKRVAEKREKQETWHKHWEKEGVKVEKRLGGGKRPKKIKDID